MTFIWPAMLVCLLALPALVAFYVAAQARRRRLLAGFGSAGRTGAGATGRVAAVRRHIPATFFLVAMAVLLVSLARPQAVVALPTVTGTVILTFDISASMGANDIKPTRLEAAKIAARDFVLSQPSTVQVGVVSFSNGGFSIQAPTNDQEAVLAAIARLTVQTGTSLNAGIEASLNAIAASTNSSPAVGGVGVTGATAEATPEPVAPASNKSAVIVLLSDGENNGDRDSGKGAQEAADRGVRISTIGVGSAAGATLQLDGYTVRTRLDEATLQQIAQTTGGNYYNAQSSEDLSKIYDNISPQIILKEQDTEVTSLFAGAGMVLLLLGGSLSMLLFGRMP